MGRTPRSSDWRQAWDWSFGLVQDLRLAWRLMLDRRVPWVTKAIPVAAIAYVLSPVDFLPDFLLGLGQLDDVAILLLGLKAFISMSPQSLVERYVSEIRMRSAAPAADPDEGDYITAEYRVMDDD
jgi:uncharacterized membrane protein YkvA (DUF1232 family)